jgi:hypothetical protein
MKYLIRKTTKTVGFGSPKTTRTIENESELVQVLVSALGIGNWNEVPEDIRKNGRDSVGRLHGIVSCADLEEADDRAAVYACLSEARKRNRVCVEEIVFEIPE